VNPLESSGVHCAYAGRAKEVRHSNIHSALRAGANSLQADRWRGRGGDWVIWVYSVVIVIGTELR